MYGTTRSKMSTVMNEGVNIPYKLVTSQVFTQVGFLVEISIATEKNSYIESSTSIS